MDWHWQTDVDSIILDYLWFVYIILRKLDQERELAFFSCLTLILKDYAIKKDKLIPLLIGTLFTPKLKCHKYFVIFVFQNIH